MNIIQTTQLNEAYSLSKLLIESKHNKIGRLLGAPGTGKTIAGKWLARQFRGVRVCARSGMSKKDLVVSIARGFDLHQPTGTAGTWIERISEVCDGRLIIIDEANHLNWQHLELLRYLPDEAGASLLLIGTELLERPFRDGRSSIYLAQLASRIGAKQTSFKPTKDLEELTAIFINPVFGGVSKGAAKRFAQGCGGLWRNAVELTEACQRIMQHSKLKALSEEVVVSAQSYMAKSS